MIDPMHKRSIRTSLSYEDCCVLIAALEARREHYEKDMGIYAAARGNHPATGVETRKQQELGRLQILLDRIHAVRNRWSAVEAVALRRAGL